MRELIKVIKKLQKEKPLIYRGDDFFDRLALHTTKGISQEKLDKLKAENHLSLPKEYEEFLKFSNGLMLWDDDPEGFYPFEEVIEFSTISEHIKEKKLMIGCFSLDGIYMDTTTSDGQLYYSSEDMSPLEPLHMGFNHFFDLILRFGGTAFWIWELGIFPGTFDTEDSCK